MAIRGRLDELQAAEVLQFLTQSGRSGVLRFRDPRRAKYLSFETGRLVFAASDHQMPSLVELLVQRGVIQSTGPRPERRPDEELARALDWRTSRDAHSLPAALLHTRVGRLLVRRRCLTSEELASALDPNAMPDSVLADALVYTGAVTRAGIAQVRASVESNVALHDAILELEVLTPRQIALSIEGMAEESLARWLVTSDRVKSDDAAFCMEQIEALRAGLRRRFHVVDYLVSCGKLTQSRLESALRVPHAPDSPPGETLVEQGILTSGDLADAERGIADLRVEFSPLRSLRAALLRDHGFTAEQFSIACEEHRLSESTLASILVESGRVAEADLRKEFENGLSLELSDLMLWQEGTYEFFEGLTLADALGEDGLDRIHGYSFEVSSLLLDAHSRVDELRRTSFRNLGPSTILKGISESEGRCELMDEDARLLRRFDGERTLGGVCAVLPGTLLQHSSRIASLVEKGLALPLIRHDAFECGQASLARQESAQAIAFFDHARRAAGHGPEDAELRIWIQRAQVAGSRRVVKRIVYGVCRACRAVSQLGGVGKAALWCGRFDAVARPWACLVSVWHETWARWSRASRRTALTIQDFMTQKGLARRWWTVRRKIVNPLSGWGGRPVPKLMTPVVAVLMVAVALIISGVTRLDADESIAKIDDALRALRAPIRKMRFETPVEVAPEMTANALYVTTRDGILHGMPIARRANAKEWSVQLGKFGDLLSSPVRFQDMLFVTNERGAVHAVTTSGERVWTKLFPRVERIAPAVIQQSRTKAAGVAIAARASLFVLHPEDGRVLYRLRCGNVIGSRPVVDGDRIFVGSADNHVYCSDWCKRIVLWDTELGDDVVKIIRVEDALIALVRGGGLVALRMRDGAVLWAKADETRRVRSIWALRDGHLGSEMDEGGGEILDAATGERFRTVDAIQHETSVRMHIADTSAFYYSERGDIGQVDEHGGQLWECRKVLRRITSLTYQGDSLIVTNREGSVWIFSLRHRGSNGALSND